MRPRRKSDRMACKHCPACEEQVPVACKFCPCGHQFPTRSKTKQKKEEDKQSNKDDNSGPESMEPSEKSNASEGGELSSKRRTVRTKRFRPDFFTPMDDQASRRKTKEGSEKSTDKAKRRRNRSKSSTTSTTKEEPTKQAAPSTPDDELFVNLSAEKALQYSVILAELNRKLTTQHFKPL